MRWLNQIRTQTLAAAALIAVFVSATAVFLDAQSVGPGGVPGAGGGGGGGAVASVFGRTGAVVANTGDYTCSQVTGCLSSAPVTTVFGRTGAVVATSGDYTAAQVTGAATSGANSNITSLTGLTTPLSIAQGGIGAASFSAAGLPALASANTFTQSQTITTASGNAVIQMTSPGGHAWQTTAGGTSFGSVWYYLYDSTAGTVAIAFDTGATNVQSSAVIGWSSGNNPTSAADTGLSRGAAAVVDCGNGTTGNTTCLLRLGAIGSGSSSNTDLIGEVALSAATSAPLVTFSKTYTSHPECNVTPQASTSTSGSPWVTYTGVTSATVNFASAFTGSVSYFCGARN